MTPAVPIMIQVTSGAPSAPILGIVDQFWIFVAIAIGSIIVEWLNKRKQSGNTDASKDETASIRTTPATPSPADSRPAATSEWEEELRRLLRGEPPVAKPPPVPPPQPTATPPPIRPVVIQAPRPVSLPPPVVPTTLAGTVMAEAEKSVEVQLPTLRESGAAYHRASHLQEQVMERLKHVEELTTRHPATAPTAHRPAVSSDAVRSIAFIRDRNTVRQAIVAGLVFGPPKGLENE